jgi:molybdopterin synthase catalytic subunit
MFINGPIPFLQIERAYNESAENVGANTFFIGKVRADTSNNSVVQSIEFTAQKEIAERVVNEIIEFSRKEFEILKAEIWHSLGLVPVGEPCFLVTVSAKHREESFKALQYIVDEIKKQCPIFGKEIFKDGNYRWKTIRESINLKG